MNGGTKPNVFLERRSYRQRRMLDALRLLPILATLLWLLPLFWPVSDAAGANVAMSDALTYIFCVWLVMTVACAALARVLRPTLDRGTEPAAGPGPSE